MYFQRVNLVIHVDLNPEEDFGPLHVFHIEHVDSWQAQRTAERAATLVGGVLTSFHLSGSRGWG